MVTTAQQHSRCSEVSLQAGEMLVGTATFTQVLFLLEYDRAWGAKALEESDLRPELKERLAGLGKENRSLKILLIRQPRSHKLRPARFYVAYNDEKVQRLFKMDFQDDRELLELNFQALLHGQVDDRLSATNSPLFLVCTNGRRDVCCSRQGIPVFNTLAKILGESTSECLWQSSHVGGHRFAANVIDLPSGVLYGRVDVENAHELMQYALRREVYLPNLRGRMSYQPPAQAADYYLRQKFARFGLDRFKLEKMQELEPGRWVSLFHEMDRRRVHEVVVRAETPDLRVYDGCQLDKFAKVTHFLLESIRELEMN